MAQFLRGKQAGVQRDLSEGLAPELFALDVVSRYMYLLRSAQSNRCFEVARYGVNSQVSALAYDPVQSLLAVGTNESRFGTGQIYIFGGKRVVFVFQPPRLASVRSLQFCADRLLVVDSRNDVTIFSLTNKKIDVSYTPPGVPCALLTDPSLDYAFIGLQNGSSGLTRFTAVIVDQRRRYPRVRHGQAWLGSAAYSESLAAVQTQIKTRTRRQFGHSS